ncbi:MAG TPA: cryptochrome/photolyase family protein [Geminicoccus sp.]|jgi:deoxyribodipyrimidine photolyase-related protein|uniref:cryptochrome/photolyase family protein n=1 Tax=Geminicoccus sp. TaxID=2024832 RepID=UPI002E3699D0|nr:cryptochrome/photolyase family protein [Geminicoccus sp.]HEX2528312.1 cryptochrome/photolyase family protein [Geminicoccus sp.]
MAVLRLVLGDQLSQRISSLSGLALAEDLVLMCEVQEEATYVRHHQKKIAFLFSAMRHFAAALAETGCRVRYVRLDEPGNSGSFRGEVERALAAFPAGKVVVTMPGEHRVLADMATWPERLGVPVEIRKDDRFLCGIEEFQAWAAGRRVLRMEFFYREMRRKHRVLMAGDQPEGGRWNYDVENRKALADGGLLIPPPTMIEPDATTLEVIDLVRSRFGGHFGDLLPFRFAVTRDQALQVLADFLEQRLPLFGDFQDNMMQGQPWMYHAHLSFYLNCGLLDPLEVVRAAEQRYWHGQAPLNAVEGFIRQILGWREYVRGIYWLKMPGYAALNFLAATRPLPWFYWSGETDMNCLRQCIAETKESAYAHHIQRLMVLGNFALLAGLDPRQVNEWYLVVYADAYEWVELPNVSGMILFADGGYLGSKPYAAGGAYVDRMSDYCRSCRYDVKAKSGPKACPFNYLYWNFLLSHRTRLKNNPRLQLAYRSLDRMSTARTVAIQMDAARFLGSLRSDP